MSLPKRGLAEGRTETVRVSVDGDRLGVVAGQPVDEHHDCERELDGTPG